VRLAFPPLSLALSLTDALLFPRPQCRPLALHAAVPAREADVHAAAHAGWDRQRDGLVRSSCLSLSLFVLPRPHTDHLLRTACSDVWPLSSISAARKPELVALCKDLYYTQLMGTLGVPDMLESVCPIARSFSEVEKLCVDSWTQYEPFITDDVEATAQSRRCVPVSLAQVLADSAHNPRSGCLAATSPCAGSARRRARSDQRGAPTARPAR